MGKVDDVVMGRRGGVEREALSGIVEGQVVAILSTGITFTTKSWDGGTHLFGPAPYTWPAATVTDNGTLGGSPHTHTLPIPANKPVKGDRCLVVFTDNGPWVIGWWPS